MPYSPSSPSLSRLLAVTSQQTPVTALVKHHHVRSAPLVLWLLMEFRRSFHRSRPSTSNPRVGQKRCAKNLFPASITAGHREGPFRGCVGTWAERGSRCAGHEDGGVSVAPIQFSAVSGSTPESGRGEHPRATLTTLPLVHHRGTPIPNPVLPFSPVNIVSPVQPEPFTVTDHSSMGCSHLSSQPATAKPTN